MKFDVLFQDIKLLENEINIFPRVIIEMITQYFFFLIEFPKKLRIFAVALCKISSCNIIKRRIMAKKDIL